MLKNKKGEFPIVGALIVVIMGIIMLSIIWGMFTSATNYERQTDTWTFDGTTIPVNISLTQTPGIALLNITNSSGFELIAANYTDAVTSGYVTLLDNGTFWGQMNLDIRYSYQQVGYIPSGITRVVLSFIAIFLGIALLIFMIKRGD